MVNDGSKSRIYRISDDLNLIDLMPPVPGFDEFLGCYVLRGERIALIDVGPSNCVPTLLRGLAILNVSPEEISHILVTHIHIDHAGGLGTLTEYMPQAKIIVHEKGKPHVIDPEKLWEGSKQTLGELAERYGRIEPVPEDRVIVAEEGMEIDLGRGISLRVLETLGHASHHLSFVEKRDRVLFAGEAAGIFAKGAMRPASPPPFNLEKALASLDKLIAIAPSTLCYGHFDCTDEANAKLRMHKEQVVLWSKVIADCVAKGTGMDEMTRELIEKDELLRELDNLPEAQLQRESFFLGNCIAGFVAYFNKYGIPENAA